LVTESGVFPTSAFDQRSHPKNCLAREGSRCSTRFCAKCVVCFDQRPPRRNPKSVSAAAQAVKSPRTVGHGSRGNFSFVTKPCWWDWLRSFEMDAARGACGTLQGHIARANPLWKEVPNGAEVLVIFQGHHGYISPSWYPSKHETHRHVPTWNYEVVHAHGKPTDHRRREVRSKCGRSPDAKTRSRRAAPPGECATQPRATWIRCSR
jgi:hypothetical protein